MILNYEEIQEEIESYMNFHKIKQISWQTKGYEFVLYKKKLGEFRGAKKDDLC